MQTDSDITSISNSDITSISNFYSLNIYFPFIHLVLAPQMVEELMHHWLVMFCEVSSATTDDASSRLALRVEKLELLTERICQQIDEQALNVEEQTRTEIKVCAWKLIKLV